MTGVGVVASMTPTLFGETHAPTHYLVEIDVTDESVHGEEPLPILFIFFVLLLGAICKQMFARVPLPYTCVLLLFGAAIGIVVRTLDLNSFSRSVLFLAGMDPHVLLYVFLPPLIFESSFSIEWHMFKNIGLSSIFAAGPGMLLGSSLTSLVLHVLYPDWNLVVVMLFGAVLSATDPVAVVALLKEMGAPAPLSAFIEGESLLNDGTAMVAFTILIEGARYGEIRDGPTEIIWAFCRMSIGGPIFGVLCGTIWVKWIGFVFNDAMVEITATITAAYLTYFVAEFYLASSGILAVVALGLLFGSIGRTSISPEVEHFLQEFWELLAYLANTLIFVLTGLIIVINSIDDLEVQDFFNLAIIYIALNVIRFIMLCACYPVISRLGYGIDFQGIIVASWGGLRGAVGLALALVIFHDTQIQELHGKAVTDRVLFHASGIVMLTLLVNATSMNSLLSWLGMDKVAHSKEVLFNLAMREIENAGKQAESDLKLDPIYAPARWSDVRRFKFKVGKVKVRLMARTVTSWQINESEREEARRRFLIAVKASYWEQFKDGILGRHAVRELIELTARSLDHLANMEEWDGLHKMLSVSNTSHFAHRLLGVPGVRAIVRRYLFHRLQYGYDCVTSFVVAREDALKKITSTIQSEELMREIREHVYDDVSKAKKALFDIQRVLPEISASIATNAAARSVLNSQRRAVLRLLHDGLLDTKEATRVVVAVETQMKRLLYTPPFMQLPAKEQLLQEIPFLAAMSKANRTMVVEKAVEVMFEEGDAIVKEGDHDDHVYLIARGTVRVSRKVNHEIKHLEELGVGSFIGEMSWVTGAPRFATVRASSPVICFCLNSTTMKELVKSAKEVEYELWHTAGCRLAYNMLSARKPWMNWEDLALKKWVYSSWELFVPELNCLVKTFKEPAVLLCGFAEILPLSDKDVVDFDLTHINENKTAEDRRREALRKKPVRNVRQGSAGPDEFKDLASALIDEKSDGGYSVFSATRARTRITPLLDRLRHKRQKDAGDSNSEHSQSTLRRPGRIIHRAPFLLKPGGNYYCYRVRLSPNARLLVPPEAEINAKAKSRWQDALKTVTKKKSKQKKNNLAVLPNNREIKHGEPEAGPLVMLLNHIKTLDREDIQDMKRSSRSANNQKDGDELEVRRSSTSTENDADSQRTKSGAITAILKRTGTIFLSTKTKIQPAVPMSGKIVKEMNHRHKYKANLSGTWTPSGPFGGSDKNLVVGEPSNAKGFDNSYRAFDKDSVDTHTSSFARAQEPYNTSCSTLQNEHNELDDRMLSKDEVQEIIHTNSLKRIHSNQTIKHTGSLRSNLSLKRSGSNRSDASSHASSHVSFGDQLNDHQAMKPLSPMRHFGIAMLGKSKSTLFDLQKEKEAMEAMEAKAQAEEAAFVAQMRTNKAQEEEEALKALQMTNDKVRSFDDDDKEEHSD